MNKRDLALSLLVSLSIGWTGATISSQLGIEVGQESTTEDRDTPKPSKHPLVLETVGGPSNWHEIYDVIVVGSGAAGLMAGISALCARPGLRVLIIEQKDAPGGSSLRSEGVVWLPNTRATDESLLTKEVCETTFPDLFDPDLEYFGLTADDYSRVRQFISLAPSVEEHLRSLSHVFTPFQSQSLLGIGVALPARLLLNAAKSVLTALEPVHPHYISHLQLQLTRQLLGTGTKLVQCLLGQYQSMSGQLLLSETVDSIVRDEEKVVGVRLVDGRYLAASRGVVFATGGLKDDPSQLKKYFNLEDCQVQTQDGNHGDFLRMCEKMDARIDLDRVPSLVFSHDISSNDFEAFVVLDNTGRKVPIEQRFPYRYANDDSKLFVITNGSEPNPKFQAQDTVKGEDFPNLLQNMVHKFKPFIQLSVFEENCTKAMQQWPDPTDFLSYMITPHLIETRIGCKVDCQGRVLGEEDKPIDRLFACGSCVTSLAEDMQHSSGAPLANALVSGYIAGTHVTMDSSQQFKSKL